MSFWASVSCQTNRPEEGDRLARLELENPCVPLRVATASRRDLHQALLAASGGLEHSHNAGTRTVVSSILSESARIYAVISLDKKYECALKSLCRKRNLMRLDSKQVELHCKQ